MRKREKKNGEGFRCPGVGLRAAAAVLVSVHRQLGRERSRGRRETLDRQDRHRPETGRTVVRRHSRQRRKPLLDPRVTHPLAPRSSRMARRSLSCLFLLLFVCVIGLVACSLVSRTGNRSGVIFLCFEKFPACRRGGDRVREIEVKVGKSWYLVGVVEVAEKGQLSEETARLMASVKLRSLFCLFICPGLPQCFS